MTDVDWIEKRIAELTAEHGAVPPPWVLFPDTHPYDICWRMGAGEAHVMVFSTWWERQASTLGESQRVAYFRQWPPPPRWLAWMVAVVWDVEPEEGDADPFFTRAEELGFGTRAEYERDLADPKWLRESS